MRGTCARGVRTFSHGIDLAFRSKVTFFVGENGSGKSTLLEALAECGGFNPEGGKRLHRVLESVYSGIGEWRRANQFKEYEFQADRRVHHPVEAYLRWRPANAEPEPDFR